MRTTLASLDEGSASEFDRHFPDDTQIRGNHTTVPAPRRLYPLCRRPVARIWRSALVWNATCPDFPPFRQTPPVVFTWPSIPRPTPVRVFAVDHRSGSGFSGIGLSMTVTSANWNGTHRPWRTTLAPILTSFPGASSMANARPPRVAPTSPFGYKETFGRLKSRSAYTPTSDISGKAGNVSRC